MKLRKIQNKKAIVLPETLKIIIAVACILLLVYLAVKMYGIFTRSSDLEKARGTLDAIIGKAGAVSEGEVLNYLVMGPKGWRMVFYQEDSKLCICPKAEGNALKEMCKSQGACKTTSLPLQIMKSCEPYGANPLANCWDFGDSIPFSMIIEKHDGKISINGKAEMTLAARAVKPISISSGDSKPVEIQELSTYLRLKKTPATTADFTYKLYTNQILSGSTQTKGWIMIRIDNLASDSIGDYYVGIIKPDSSLWFTYKYSRLIQIYDIIPGTINFEDKKYECESIAALARDGCGYGEYLFYKSDKILDYNAIKLRFEEANAINK